jgi:hypothetical protein
MSLRPLAYNSEALASGRIGLAYSDSYAGTAYPNIPLYFESYTGQNTSLEWQNFGTLGGSMYVVDGQPGRPLSREKRPAFMAAIRAELRPWQIPNVSEVPSDYTFYVVVRGTSFEDVAGVGGYLIDISKPDGSDRVIFGYANPQGTAEVSTFYQFGVFQENGPALRAPAGLFEIFAIVCQAGQPVRVYDKTDALRFTSSVIYQPFAIKYEGLTSDGRPANRQVLGSSRDLGGRVTGADFAGFAVDTKAHTTKAQRDAVRAKWRADLNI